MVRKGKLAKWMARLTENPLEIITLSFFNIKNCTHQKLLFFITHFSQLTSPSCGGTCAISLLLKSSVIRDFSFKNPSTSITVI